ncbi:MAG TPA: hypothetical protein VG965_03985 [Patescibacteria group bacterium]|nr:hypothetical protein [Patescibacteria group bacterium]
MTAEQRFEPHAQDFAGRAELRTSESPVMVMRNFPLAGLLEPKDQNNPISTDRVSIYTIPRPEGTEYAVVFAPKDGIKLLDVQNSVSVQEDGFTGVIDDYNMILSHRGGNGPRLRGEHGQGMGLLWGAYFSSVRLQRDVLFDGNYNNRIMQHEFRKDSKAYNDDFEATRRLLEILKSTTGTTVEEVSEGIEHLKQDAKDALEDRCETDVEFLRKFFNLKGDEVRRFHKSKKLLSIGKAAELLRGKGSPKQLADFEPAVVAAAKAKSGMIVDENGDVSYNEVQMTKMATASFADVRNCTVIQINERKYGFPHDVVLEGFLNDKTGMKIKINVDEEGRVEYDDTIQVLESHLAGLKKPEMKPLPHGRLAIPIVRILEDDNGNFGFILNELKTSPELPEAVLNDIVAWTDDVGGSILESDKSWISGMVGVQMLTASHPTIRKIEDTWSLIWGKKRITFADVTGDAPKHKINYQFFEDQVNGPVQSGVIALQALSRYPEHFIPFIDNVKAVAGEGSELK